MPVPLEQALVRRPIAGRPAHHVGPGEERPAGLRQRGRREFALLGDRRGQGIPLLQEDLQVRGLQEHDQPAAGPPPRPQGEVQEGPRLLGLARQVRAPTDVRHGLPRLRHQLLLGQLPVLQPRRRAGPGVFPVRRRQIPEPGVGRQQHGLLQRWQRRAG